MCQAPSSLLPPPPGSPLCPLHSLARALTCEIKRHFNYLSAKQQLERITAQQHPPSPLPAPGPPPALLSSLHPASSALRLDVGGKSSSPAQQHLCLLHPKRESVLGVRTKEYKRLPRKGRLCTCILETVSTQLTEVQVGTMVCICVPDTLVPAGACAL